MRRVLSLLACASILASGLVAATPAAASDVAVPLPTTPGQYDLHDLVVDSSAGRVFLSTVNGLDVRDLSGATVSTGLSISSTDGLALSADGAVLYVAEPADHAIGIVDTATLGLTATISAGDGVTPRTLALVGSALWFGYDAKPGSGGIGVVDLSLATPTVTAPATIANNTDTSIWWYGAPALVSSPAVPDTLFAGDRLTSPRPIEKFTASGATLTATAVSAPAGSPTFVTDLAVSRDGAELFAPNGSGVIRLRTSDLVSTGVVSSNAPVHAIAVAPDDGRLALGNDASGSQPAVYTYSADGTFGYQYAYQDGWGTAAAGLAFDASGNTLYAVTQGPDSGSPGGWRYQLHVISDTHDTARPPAPEGLVATPDFRTIVLTWFRLGLYAPADEDSFTVYRGTTPDALSPYVRVASSGTAVQNWTDDTVDPGTTYYYAVTASNAGGESDQSVTASTGRNDRAIVFADRRFGGPPGTVDLAYVSDGGPLHRITPVSDHYSDPAASPDGTAVAYALAGAAGTHLWRMPLSGGAAQQLTTGSGTDGWPTWSPDGSRIAFTRTLGGTTSVWTLPAAGGTATQVPGTTGDRQPSWSPGGGLLAVTDGVGAASQIVVTSLDGGYRRVVAGTNGNLPSDKCYSAPTGPSLPTLCNYSGAGASWSPDGRSLALLQTTPGGTTPAVVPSAGGAVDYSLFEGFGHATSVSWSPDGTRIVRAETPSLGASVIQQSAPDGTGRAQLSPGDGWAEHPSVTGARVAYAPLPSASAVGTVSASLGASTVTLRWARSSDTAYVTIRRSAAGGSAPAAPTDGVAVYTGTATSATATGLVGGASYRFSIFSFSANGDAGSATSIAAAPASTPVMSPNGYTPAALYRGGPAFVARWGRPLAAGQTYDVQIGTRTYDARSRTWSVGPVWHDVITGTTSTQRVVSASAGTTYYLRARVRDGYGNATAWSGIATVPVPYDDRSATASPGWAEKPASGRFESTVRVTGHAGAWLQWRTSASQLGVLADRCATCGRVRVYVDGALRATVDTYAGSTRVQQVIWQLRFRGIGTHTIRLVALGTSGRPAVHVDGLIATR